MPEVLSDFEQQLVSFIDQQYNLTGEVLSAEKALQEFGIPKPKFEAAWGKDLFKEALVERGIVLERLEPEHWTSRALTPTQLMLANAILDTTDARSTKKKCQDLQVSTLKYETWLRDPVFIDYMRQRAEQKIGNAKHEADLAFLDRIRIGDMKAIQLYYEITGVYTPSSARGNQQIDVNGIIVQILEIIDECVESMDDKLKVSEELKKLIARRGAAEALTNPSAGMDSFDHGISTPEVVKLGELPSERSA